VDGGGAVLRTRTSIAFALVVTAAVAAADAAPAAADACAADAKGAYARVELFREPDCRGAAVSVGFSGPGDRPDFAAFTNYDGAVYDVDDTRSSLALEAATCVRLFDGRDFAGEASDLLCAPATTTGFFPSLGALDNRVSSMRVCPASVPSGCDRPAPPVVPPAPVPNGSPASANARLTVGFARRGAARTVRFGRGASVAAALTDELGRPIAGAALQVRVQELRAGADWAVAPDVTTGPDGRVELPLPPGPSRRVRFEYRDVVGAPLPVAADQARLAVRAGVTLSVRPRRVSSGGTIRLRGRLGAAPATGLGKLVTLQARERGRWRDFQSARTGRSGRFKARYRFTPGARGTFPLRAVARSDASYPYATGRSRPVRVRVG
jgi:hypothetical protein